MDRQSLQFHWSNINRWTNCLKFVSLTAQHAVSFPEHVAGGTGKIIFTKAQYASTLIAIVRRQQERVALIKYYYSKKYQIRIFMEESGTVKQVQKS